MLGNAQFVNYGDKLSVYCLHRLAIAVDLFDLDCSAAKLFSKNKTKRKSFSTVNRPVKNNLAREYSSTRLLI